MSPSDTRPPGGYLKGLVRPPLEAVFLAVFGSKIAFFDSRVAPGPPSPRPGRWGTPPPIFKKKSSKRLPVLCEELCCPWLHLSLWLTPNLCPVNPPPRSEAIFWRLRNCLIQRLLRRPPSEGIRWSSLAAEGVGWPEPQVKELHQPFA